MQLPIRLARSALEGHAVAVLATATMLLLRYSLNDLMVGDLPLMASLFAVIVAAWYGGLWSGLLATLLSAVVSIAVFADGGWRSVDTADGLLLTGFVLIGSVTSLLFEALHLAYAKVGAGRSEVQLARIEGGRSHAQVRDAELRRRLVIEVTSDAIYEWDVRTDQVIWNEGVNTLFGFRREILGGGAAWWGERIHPLDRERVKASASAALKSRQKRWSGEYRLQCADGRDVWVLNRAGLTYDADGKPLRVVGAVQDISERQRSLETQAHFKALFEAQPAPVLVMDPTLRIVAASEAYLRATMRQRSDIVGELVFEAFPDDAEAAGAGPVRASFERVLASGHAEQLPIQQYAVQRPESEGGGFKKILWSLYHFPVRGPHDEIAFVVQRAEDVTDYVDDGSLSPTTPDPRNDALRYARDFEHARVLAQANRRLGEVNARLAFFAELSEATRVLREPQQIVSAIVEKLGGHLAVQRCTWIEFADDGDQFEVLGDYTDGVPAMCSRHRRSDYGLPMLTRGASAYVMEDIEADPEARAFVSSYRAIQARATLSVPLRLDGRLVAALAVHQSSPRRWTPDEIDLVEQVAERCREAFDRARAERAVTASEARLRDILDRVPVKTVTMTTQCRLDYAGPVTLDYIGVAHGATVTDWSWPELVYPEDRARADKMQACMLRGDTPDQEELRLQRRDGAARWHLVRFLPLEEADGRVTLWVGAWTDLHDLKAAELRLREADRAKDEFLATLAHELRNPIAPLSNGVALLQRVGDDARLRAQMLELMSRQLAQMVRLIDDLLDVSRITTGKLVLRRSDVLLTEVVRNAVESVEPLVRAGGHQLEVTLPDAPVALHADASRLAQVLGNLLTNSVKYSERPGIIRLEAELADGEVRIAVRDQGIGIAPDVLPRVFEMFAQSDRALSLAQGGLGIGLSLVRRLVEMHGGRVQGASDGLGHGSTFTIYLPLPASIQTSNEDARRAAINDAAGASGSRRRVLVADDNDDSAHSLAALLEIWGHEVMIANDGEIALQRAAEFRPDAMVLDLGMPRRDGLETAREVRRQPWGHKVTLIALSGWGQPADRERTRDAGFDHHLVKPVDSAKLEKLLGE